MINLEYMIIFIRRIVLLILVIFLLPLGVRAASLSEKLKGLILLDVERNGEAWYVYPENNLRYYLGRPADAFAVMRELGLGISEINFQRIAQAGMPVAGDLSLASRLAGKIIIQTEKNGEAWYVYPKDLKKYYLGRPVDAFSIMRKLGLGITRADLAQIHKPDKTEAINQYSRYELKKKISTVDGEFLVDAIEIDLANPSLKIITATADSDSCQVGCTAKPLINYVLAENGFAGINGTYFCNGSGCGAQNYYFFPVFNTKLRKLINEDQLKYWTTGPIMAWDENNKFYYFKDSREFTGVESFESLYGVKLQAAIGNKPRLIENGLNQLIDWEVDKSQREKKDLRNAIAYKDNPLNSGKGKIYLVVARNATVPDLANIMKAMGVDYALNLDGGSSAALYYNDEYMIGPGRNVPNAIVFAEE